MRRQSQSSVVLESSQGDALTTWHSYQSYYVMGLRMLEDVSFRYSSPLESALLAARERGWRGTHTALRLIAGRNAELRRVEATHVGRYTFRVPDRDSPLRVAIDAHDGRKIRDPDALEWSDLYFKVSYWPNLDYGPKVRPLICGNGMLDRAALDRLIAMRNRPRDLDLVFVANLWPSNPADPTYWNSVEHVVRVFEALARLKIRSHLRAITVPLAGDEPFPKRYLDRLASAGVPTSAIKFTAEDLWAVTSSAQLAFMRPGKHLCISWRMIDHLAMGACTLCDNAAYPVWPVPLREGHEFMNSRCGIGEDESLPDPADYERISASVMALLAQPELMEQSRREAADYFDAHVAPQRLARHLMDAAKVWPDAARK